MADDSDVVYIDVAPQLDEDAARKTGDRLKDAFRGAGKSIGEALNTELGQAVRGRLEEIANDAAGRLGRAIGGTIRDAAQSAGIDIDGIADHVRTAATAFDSIKDAIAAWKTGDGGLDSVKASLDALSPLAEKFGIDVGNWKKPLDDAHSQVKDIADTGNQLGGIFKDMPGSVGKLGTALEALDHGPLRDALEIALEINNVLGIDKNTFDPGKRDWPHILFGNSSDFFGGDPSKDLPIPFIGKPPQPKVAPITPDSLTGKMILGQGGNASLSSWIQQGEAAAGVDGSWTPGLMTLIGRESSGNPGAINLWDSNAKAGHPSQGLMQLIPGSFAANHVPGTSNSITDPVANIAAGIKYIQANYGGIGGVQQANPNMPPKGYAGGGMLPGGSPGYDNLLGSLGGSPVGLEGGEFVVNPGATQANLGLLQAINGGMHFDSGGQLPFLPQLQSDLSKGPGVQGQKPPGVQGQSPSGVQGQKPQGVQGQSPSGVQGQKPAGVIPDLSKPVQAPDQPSPAQTIIPQGQGKGFDISGGIIGGLEGAASQAAGIAASAGTFGAAGGAASSVTDLAFKEANRAIAYGVRAGTTLAVEAPLDTFWLSDSGLSDPSHSWFGKLGLNLIGQTGAGIQNLAGQTQAPLTAGQGQGSPLGGQQKSGGGPAVHIENQYNNSDVDHMNNNQTIAGQLAAHSATSNSAYGY